MNTRTYKSNIVLKNILSPPALNVAQLTKHRVSLVTVNKQHFFLPTFQTPNIPINAYVALLHLPMATIGDFTDPEGTKYPNKDLFLESTHIFKPVIVTERPSRPNLPANISPINIYGIFSLFFTTDILETIAKNTNKYAALHRATQSKPPS